MDISIDEIFKYLSSRNSDDVQKYGIALASTIKNMSILIMPIEDKSIWENCAKILVDKNDEELCLYLFELFEWLKDMNWPGAYLIYDRLICLSDELFFSAYQHSLSMAQQLKDHVWEMVLKDLLNDRTTKTNQLTVL